MVDKSQPRRFPIPHIIFVLLLSYVLSLLVGWSTQACHIGSCDIAGGMRGISVLIHQPGVPPTGKAGKWNSPHITAHWIAGFQYGHQWDSRRTTYLFTVPIWFLLLFIILPFWIRHRRIQRRWQNGLCPKCGYDMRATRERCPECGAAAIPASQPVVVVSTGVAP